jgi:hypothetical protein
LLKALPLSRITLGTFLFAEIIELSPVLPYKFAKLDPFLNDN